jgi:hypothetical protein
MNEDHPDNPRLPIAKKRTRSKKGIDSPVCPKLERHDEYAAVGTGRAEEADRKRFLVRVTSVRNRLLDEDNLCVKLVVDCCRYAGLIPGDSAGEAKIEAGQRKVTKGETPHTIVEITIFENSL